MLGTAWIAVDWGSSQLRAWAMGADGSVLQRASAERGMLTLTPDQFELVLLELVESWLPEVGVITVIACGMVGARQGWREAPYCQLPCAPLSARQFVMAPTGAARLKVYLLPGLSQALPADVMRGEETLIAGVLEVQPGFNGIVCLPGTHCKWVHVKQGIVEAFQTFMTGELFALLADHSVLKHGMAGSPTDELALALPVFISAMRSAFEQPGQLSAALFPLRAQGLLQGLPAHEVRARLSGLLIGAELAASQMFWTDEPVIIVGDSGVAELYAEALQNLGITPQRLNAEVVTLAGLKAARSLLGIQ